MVQAIPGGQRGGGGGWEAVGRRRGQGGTYSLHHPTFNQHTQYVHHDEKICNRFPGKYTHFS